MLKHFAQATAASVAAAACFSLASPSTAFAVTADALAGHSFGLHDSESFRLIVGGECGDCPEPKAVRWYFMQDIVAAPKKETAANSALGKLPFLIWLSAPEIVTQVKLAADGEHITLSDNNTLDFAIVPKITSNRSYYNETSVQFFSQRPLRIRGTSLAKPGGGKTFVARVIWPEDYAVDVSSLTAQPLSNGESVATLIEADQGGANTAFSARLLWSRGTPQAGGDRAILGLVLNGAQGDDDEAHGGHFAVMTGRYRTPRDLPDWTVNNFYNLGTVSEKGIIAAMLPMDNYMMDLNSGQSYYRPSYLMFIVLRSPEAAVRFQDQIISTYDRFYRHAIEYDHALLNCAGISVDTLRTIGWNIPALGPTSYAKATAGYFYSSATDLSYTSGRKTFNYLTEDQTRLYPRAAFEVATNDLLALLNGTRAPLTAYEQLLKDAAEAVVFVRVPQVPSSRAFGTYPVGSFDAYMARVPKDRKDWKIVPVDSRPFPDDLRDTPASQPMLSDQTIGTAATLALVGVIAAPIAWLRLRKNTRRIFG